jgi:hypothetical protein
MLPSSSTDWPFRLDDGSRSDLYRAPAPAQVRHGIALECYLERQKASRASAISKTDLGRALKPLPLSTAQIVLHLFGLHWNGGQDRRCAPDADGEALRFAAGEEESAPEWRMTPSRPHFPGLPVILRSPSRNAG